MKPLQKMIPTRHRNLAILVLSIVLLFQLGRGSFASSLTITIGSGSGTPGGTVVIPLTVSSAPTNLSAFCLFVTNAPGFLVPSASPGTAQSNLITFVDDFGGGVYRVTGFVTSDPPIGNGPVVNLAYNVPNGVAAGTYPLILPPTPPVDAPLGSNPEARALVPGGLLAASGSAGAINIGNVSPPQLTSFFVLANQSVQFSFTNVGGASFTVFASTNITLPFSNWMALGPVTQASAGVYQFTDRQATNFPSRFYRVRSP